MDDKLNKLKLLYGGAVSEVSKGEIYEVDLKHTRFIVYKDKLMNVGLYTFSNKTDKHIVLKSIHTDTDSIQLIDLDSYKQYIIYDSQIGYKILTDLSINCNNITIANDKLDLMISRYFVNGVVTDVWIKDIIDNKIRMGVFYVDTQFRTCTLIYDKKRGTWSIDG